MEIRQAIQEIYIMLSVLISSLLVLRTVAFVPAATQLHSSFSCTADCSPSQGVVNQNVLFQLQRDFNANRNDGVTATELAAGFEYNDFGDDEDDDEDDEDDDEYIDIDDSAVANFKAMMGIPEEDTKDAETEEDEDDYPELVEESDISNLSSVDQLISFATTKSSDADLPPTDWAEAIDISDVSKALESGVCLIANPAKFCDDFSDGKPPSLALLSKFGLTLPPPPELGPDRRADLLPVLILLDRHPLKGCHALLLNRRTGYLIGDLENQQLDNEDGTNDSPPPNLGAFMIQPLWFGGTSSGSDQKSSINGLDMIHVCPNVEGAKQITEDGLFHGGDPVQAQEAMTDPSLERPMSGFDFKFFVQSTRWLPMQVRFLLHHFDISIIQNFIL